MTNSNNIRKHFQQSHPCSESAEKYYRNVFEQFIGSLLLVNLQRRKKTKCHKFSFSAEKKKVMNICRVKLS